jgi:hypothetical protein
MLDLSVRHFRFGITAFGRLIISTNGSASKLFPCHFHVNNLVFVCMMFRGRDAVVGEIDSWMLGRGALLPPPESVASCCKSSVLTSFNPSIRQLRIQKSCPLSWSPSPL